MPDSALGTGVAEVNPLDPSVVLRAPALAVEHHSFPQVATEPHCPPVSPLGAQSKRSSHCLAQCGLLGGGSGDGEKG